MIKIEAIIDIVDIATRENSEKFYRHLGDLREFVLWGKERWACKHEDSGLPKMCEAEGPEENLLAKSYKKQREAEKNYNNAVLGCMMAVAGAASFIPDEFSVCQTNSTRKSIIKDIAAENRVKIC